MRVCMCVRERVYYVNKCCCCLCCFVFFYVRRSQCKLDLYICTILLSLYVCMFIIFLWLMTSVNIVLVKCVVSWKKVCIITVVFIIMFELIFLNLTVYQFEDFMFILCTIERFDHLKFKASIPAFSKPNNTCKLYCSPQNIHIKFVLFTKLN